MKSPLSIRQIAAVLALVAVAAIFVLPAFDMPDTNLRAKALAQLLTLMMVAVASMLTGLLAPRTVAIGRIARTDCSREFDPSLTLTLPMLC